MFFVFVSLLGLALSSQGDANAMTNSVTNILFTNYTCDALTFTNYTSQSTPSTIHPIEGDAFTNLTDEDIPSTNHTCNSIPSTDYTGDNGGPVGNNFGVIAGITHGNLEDYDNNNDNNNDNDFIVTGKKNKIVYTNFNINLNFNFNNPIGDKSSQTDKSSSNPCENEDLGTKPKIEHDIEQLMVKLLSQLLNKPVE